MFAFGLNSLFELLDVNEDCYGVGYLSKVIATELANLPAARMRRKVQFVFVRFFLWIKLFKPLKTITWLIFLQDWGVIVSHIPEWESEYDVGCK